MKGTIYQQVESLERILRRSISNRIKLGEIHDGMFVRVEPREKGWRVSWYRLDRHEFCAEFHDRLLSDLLLVDLNSEGEIIWLPNDSCIQSFARECANMLLITLCLN